MKVTEPCERTERTEMHTDEDPWKVCGITHVQLYQMHCVLGALTTLAYCIGAYYCVYVYICAAAHSASVIVVGHCQCFYRQIAGYRIGFDQLCWHNFRIIGTNFSGISIEHNSRIIGSDLHI